ncbi:MAG: outer membrane lipid asymmetry maintenance protein MlaD [Ottowia sp.]|nr:outer membrane lipid asymmetry maintenance protein MlaD [Ottowia sp.]
MGHGKSDVWVGLFVMLGVAALVFLALQSANLLTLNWQNTYRVTAYFDNVGGLKPRSAVRSGGVVVGRVADIGFDDQRYQATVALDMQTRYKFPRDSSLKILTSGLLGEQYVGIEAGADDADLANGDQITSTQSAVVLENLISRFLFDTAAGD